MDTNTIIASKPIIDGFDTYIRTELGLAKETLLAYKRDVQEFLDFVDDTELTAQVVEEFVKYLKLLRYKSTTIRRKCMSIRCLYNYLISIGQMEQNTVDVIDPVHRSIGVADVLEAEVVDILISTVEKRTPVSRTNNVRRDVAIILTLYHSGLRVSELCNINLENINWTRREIRVMGKGCYERIVPTTQECLDSIQEYINLDRQSNTNAVFVKSNGQRITRRAISDMLTTISRRAGVKHTTAHTLRRSCATSLMNNGVDLELIRILLGHRHLSTTQTYLAVNNERLVKIHETCHPFGEKCEY